MLDESAKGTALGHARFAGVGRPLLLAAIAVAATLVLPGSVSASNSGGWDHVGSGASASLPALNASVTALASSGSSLYVGGSFTDAGGVPGADRIARWDGSTWSALGTGIDNQGVYAIAVAGGKVYAGGTFQNAGGDSNADFLAVWNGTSWAHFCNAGSGPALNGEVKALQVIGNRLYVGGGFLNAAGFASADGLLECDLDTGTPSSVLLNGPGYSVYALTMDANSVLYAGGVFANFNGVANADRVARYEGGTTWSALGADGAVTGTVRSLAASGTNIYVGTDGPNVDGIPQADKVAKWNGSSWSALGSNTAGTDGWFTPNSYHVFGLRTVGSYLFATGSFQDANGVATADDVAWFDGAAWHPLGSNGGATADGPLNADGAAVAVMGGTLYVGGAFTVAGGDTQARGIASFPIERPDARIGTASNGPFIGNDHYSSIAAKEHKTIGVLRGHKGTFYVDVQNDGRLPDTLTLLGTGGAAGFNAAYFSGPKNVTQDVLHGTFSTPRLGPGTRFSLKLVVKVAASAAGSATFQVRASSVKGAPVDAVMAIVNAR